MLAFMCARQQNFFPFRLRTHFSLWLLIRLYKLVVLNVCELDVQLFNKSETTRSIKLWLTTFARMESISDIVPWLNLEIDSRNTVYNTDVYALQNTYTVSLKLQKKQKFKTVAELVKSMQLNLLFPVSHEIPFICSATTIINDLTKNTLFVCVPRYPLYYGYRMFLQIDKDKTYSVLFDPNIVSLFFDNMPLFRKINFINIPYTLVGNFLLDSDDCKHIKNWLLKQKKDIVVVSEMVKAEMDILSHSNLLENNKEIIHLLTVKYNEEQEQQCNEKHDNFVAHLKDVTNFSSLSTLLRSEKIYTCSSDITDVVIDISKTLQYIGDIQNKCQSFIEDAETLINSCFSNMNEGEIEQAILQKCEDKVIICNKYISELPTMVPACITTKVTEIFNKTPLVVMYLQMEYCYKHSNTSQLIYVDLENSTAIAKVLLNFLKKRNVYKQKDLPQTVNKYVKLYNEVIDDSSDITCYTINEIVNLIKFHSDALEVYPTMQCDTISEAVVNRSAVEFLYYNEVNGTEQIMRHGYSAKSLIKMVAEVFRIDNRDIQIVKTFQNQLSLFPNTFWEYDEDCLSLLNDVNHCIRIFTGSSEINTFNIIFRDKFDLSDNNMLSTEHDLKSFVDKISSFLIQNPAQLQYSFCVEVQEFSFQNHQENALHTKHMAPYIKNWTIHLKEFMKAKEKVFKAVESFMKIINEIKQLDVSNVSHLCTQICQKTMNKWENVIHFLSVENNGGTKINLYETLDEIISNYGDEFNNALAKCTITYNKKMDASALTVERMALVVQIINIGYRQLFSKLQFPILNLIENYLKFEENKWIKMEKKVPQSWLEDVVIKIKDDKGEHDKIMPLKEISDSYFRTILDKLRNVYSQSTLDEYLITLLKTNFEPEWIFCQGKKCEEKCPISKVIESLNLDVTCLSHTCITKLLDESVHNEQRTIKSLLSYFLALFVIEFFDKFDVLSLLIYLEKEQLQNHVNIDDPIRIAHKVFQNFPCYGLVHMINFYESSSCDVDSQTLKHQVSVYRKIHPLENESSDILQRQCLYKLNSQYSYHLTTPDPTMYFNQFLELMTKFSKNKILISLEMFQLMVSDTYWTSSFLSDLWEMQNIWGNSRKGFRFKNYKQSKKAFAQLSVIGVTHETSLEIFKLENQQNIVSAALNKNKIHLHCNSNSEFECQSIDDWKMQNYVHCNFVDKHVQTDVMIDIEEQFEVPECDDYLYDEDYNTDPLSQNLESLNISDNSNTLSDIIDQNKRQGRFGTECDKEKDITVQNLIIFNTHNFSAHKELIEDMHMIKSAFANM